MTTWTAAVDFLRAEVPEARPEVALVLGSGLGGLAETFEQARFVPYAEIPGFPASTVAGHGGRLAFGRLRGRQVVAMQGRVHGYEGYRPDEVVLPVRAMLALGPSVLVVTNAAGGLNPSFRPGTLMLIRDHLNLTGASPLTGPNDPEVGPRFPDMSTAYDRKLGSIAEAAGKAAGVALTEGVYAGVSGPAYETPAEVRMLRMLGADAVGMSTVHEVIAAVHAGARVLGISCITNLAAGLGDGPLSHDEVQEAAMAAKADLEAIVGGVVERAG